MTDAKTCPDTTTLEDFLLGRLEPPKLEQCESHVSHCEICHETMRGLSVDDTISEHIAAAFLQSDSFSVKSDEEDHVHGLVDRLLNQTDSDSPRLGGPKLSSADAEILADRAAEVLRCVTPPDEDQKTLGSIGDYQLTRLLGAGSTGVVFQAVDQNLDRMVALKVLRPSLGPIARDRFVAEARLAASIEHSNVVTIYQVGQHERLAFMAMQWLPGETLEAKLNASVTMDESTLKRVAAQVAAGLQAAHDRQLVHRDIKPANVWICDETEEVKILDFGLARIVDDNPGLTATGMLAGTPNFMSPEQTKGNELDGRSDLFSLGCMMYRMATGRLAFGATTILGTLQAIQNEQPAPPKSINAEVSDDLSDLTMSLLEKQPLNRPESAEQVIAMLKTDRNAWPAQVGKYAAATASHQAQPKRSENRRAGSGGSRWFRRIATLIATGLIGTAAFWFSPQIIRIANDQGELVIESDDKDVEVQVLQDGQVVRVLDTKTQNSFNIQSGEYQIKATGEGNTFKVTPEVMTMKRGEKLIVKVASQQSKPRGTNNAVLKPNIKARKLNNMLKSIEKLDSIIATELGKREAIKARFGEQDYLLQRDDVSSSFAEHRKLIVASLPIDQREQVPSIESIEPVPYHVDPPNVPGLESLDFDWVGFEDLKMRLEFGGVGDFEKQIKEAEIHAASPASGDGPKHPRMKVLERNIAALRKVANHLRKLDGQPPIEPLSPEQQELITRLAEERRKYMKLEDVLGRKHPRVVKSGKLISELTEQIFVPEEAGQPVDSPVADQSSTKPEQTESIASVLQERIMAHEIERAELATRFGSGHPSVETVDRKIELLKTHQKIAMANQRQATEKLHQAADATAHPIYKGKPFAHWINVIRKERSSETLSDALRALAKLASTTDERSQLLNVVRNLARKHGSAILGDNDESDRYIKALQAAISKFEPSQVMDFVLKELESGTNQSVGFCSFLLAHSLEGMTISEKHARSEPHKLAFAERSHDLVSALVARLERMDSMEAGWFLRSLRDQLAGVVEQGIFGTNSQSGRWFRESLVDELKKLNPKLAPTLKAEFLRASPNTKISICILVRAYWFNDQEIELSLQESVLDKKTSSQTRDFLMKFINLSYNQSNPLWASDLKYSAPFYVRLLENQLGKSENRIVFKEWERLTIGPNTWNIHDFAVEEERLQLAQSGRTSSTPAATLHLPPQTIKGPAVVIYRVLAEFQAWRFVRDISEWNQVLSETPVSVDLNRVLQSTIDLQGTDDPLLEDFEKALIFKNAKWLKAKLKNRVESNHSPFKEIEQGSKATDQRQ